MLRRNTLRWSLSLLLTSTAALAVASMALADPSTSDRDTARRKLAVGDAKMSKGDAAGALKAYSQAHALVHVPSTGLAVAQAQLQLGQLSEARDTCLAVSHIPGEGHESVVFATARKDCATLVQTVEERLAPAPPPVAPDTPAAHASTSASPTSVSTTTEAPSLPSTHFQMVLGYVFSDPLGGLRGSVAMSDFFKEQFGGFVEIGGRTSDYANYFAGDVEVLSGAAGDQLVSDCAFQGFDCGRALTVRIGFLYRHYFAPSHRLNPWIATELCGEAVSISLGSDSVNVSGPCLGASVGLDVRLTPGFGIGSYIGLTSGLYESTSTDNALVGSALPSSGPISVHTWFQSGLRLVLFP